MFTIRISQKFKNMCGGDSVESSVFNRLLAFFKLDLFLVVFAVFDDGGPIVLFEDSFAHGWFIIIFKQCQ